MIPRSTQTVDLILEPRDWFLLAIASGEVSFHEAVENCRDMCDFAAGLGLKKILFDCLALEGALSREERFELGKTIVQYSRSRLRVTSVALIGNPPAVTGYAARVAAEGGIPVQTFSERQQGLDWLRSQR
jgi:hypothetical protein